ncbi:MAG: hypothetical protein WC943_09165 [Elusimicrobiota bacterium]
MAASLKTLAAPENRPALFALAFLAAFYLPAFGAPFVWDDLGWILFNSALDRPLPLSGYFSDAYFRLSGETTWRPLTTAVYNGLTLAFGKSPWAFRGFGLLLHLLAGGLLLRLLTGSGLARGGALLGTALFLVHPAHVETLMCASFDEELLAACGVLSAILSHRAGRQGLAAGFVLLGLLSKETALAAIPLILLDDFCRRGSFGLRRGLPSYAVYAATALAFAWFAVFGLSAPGLGAKAAVPLPDRLGFCLQGLWAFVRVQVLPVGLRIEYFALPASGPETLVLVLFAALLVAGTGLFLRRIWRAPEDRPLALLLAWPFLFWLGISGAVPAGMLSTRLMAERWLYLPLLGACGLAAWGLQRRPRLAAAVLALLAVFTAVRVHDWTDERRLWSSLVQRYPLSAKAHEGLGDAQVRYKNFGPALASYEEALRLREERRDPVLAYYVPISAGHLNWQSPSLRRSLGAAYIREGGLDQAGRHLRKAVELAPDDPYAYRLLSYIGCLEDRFQEGLTWAEAGLSKNPDDDILLRLQDASRKRRLDFRLKLD